MPNDQVGDDFAFTFELGRLGREDLALIQRGLDFAADHSQCRLRDLGGAFKLAREGPKLGPFGFKLRVGCVGNVRMNGRTCSLVRASAVRVCAVLVRAWTWPFAFRAVLCGRVLLTVAGCAVTVYTGTCEPHFTRVCVRRSACASRALCLLS